jgi:integrase
MAKANNLELQGGTYHVRLAIPKDVQNAFGGKRILSQSLKTGARQEALDRRLPILAQWKAQIKLAREGKPLPEDWQDGIASAVEQVNALKKRRKLAAIGEPVPSLPVTDAEFQQWIRENPEEFAMIDAAVEQSMENGLEGELRLTDQLNQVFKTALQRIFTTNHNLSHDQLRELDALIQDPTSHQKKSPITKTRRATFRTYRESRNVAPKTIDQQDSKLDKLSTYLTKTKQNLDFDAISGWLDSLQVASKTLAQYLLAGSSFWKWAMKHDARWRDEYKDRANPFENHELPQVRGKARADAQRIDFKMDDLSRLHALALKEGHSALADLILLATYSGARIEELCQLKIDHVITVDGIESFDIVDSKTTAGIRIVPIHPILSSVVTRLKTESTDGYLVPSASKNKYKIRSDALSKAFGRLKTAHGFGPQQVFHSIRKTNITQLVRAGVQGTLIAELVGHETGLVTFDVYSQGASAAQKLEAISKLPSLGAVTSDGTDSVPKASPASPALNDKRQQKHT